MDIILPKGRENHSKEEQINVTPELIRSRIEEAYKADGHRPGNIKVLQVYLNLNERRAYNVINGKPENKFVET